MQFDIITIFPKFFDSFLKESLINKGIKNKLLKINVHNLRDFAVDKRKTVDDRPFGGGLGMVLMVEPIYKAIKKIKKKKKARVITFSPRGKKLNQKKLNQLKKYDQIVLICGRYEGIDERVAKHIADEELSIGDYVLMGGELGAMVFMESISRLVPGVIGKPSILKERITKTGGFVEYPQYTRPETFNKWKTPKILLSGDHKEIGKWRAKYGQVIEK